MSWDFLSSGWFAACWLGFFVLVFVAIAIWFDRSRRRSRGRRRPPAGDG